MAEKKLKYTASQIDAKLDKVGTLDSQVTELALEVCGLEEACETLTNTFIFSSKGNGYLNTSCVLTSASNCSTSEPIAVSKGDVIVMTSQGTGISCIAFSTDGVTYTAKATSSNSSGFVTHKYVAENDGYVKVSSRTVGFDNYTPIKYSSIINKRINDIELLINDTSFENKGTLAIGKKEMAVFDSQKGLLVRFKLYLSENLNGTLYLKLYNSEGQIVIEKNLLAKANTLIFEYEIPENDKYTLKYENWTSYDSFPMFTLDVEQIGELIKTNESIVKHGVVTLAIGTPELNSGYSFQNVTTSSMSPFKGSFVKASTSSTIKRTVTLPSGTYQIFAKGKIISVVDDAQIGLYTSTGLAYITKKINSVGEEFNLVTNSMTINNESTLTIMLTCASESAVSGDEIANLQVEYFAIAKVDKYVLNPNCIKELCEDGKVVGELENRYTSSINGRTWVSLGDSITAQYSYQGLVSTRFGLTCINKGVGGLTLSDNGSSGMCKNTYLSQITNDAYIITIMGGTNDFAQNIPLGQYDSKDNTTYCGALNYIIDYITENYPLARLVVMCPPLGISETLFPSANGIKNNNGNTTLDYGISAQEVCKRRGIPCIDLGQKLGWTEKNISIFVKNDGADGYAGAYFHPNDIGGSRIASVISGYLSSIIPISNKDI